MADLPHQSLYRRYRPQRFAEVRGQDHVTTALRNAVGSDRTTHAYLFSGPRGTGKTSTARILAAALNCTDRADGEPCGACESCVAVRTGASFDVVEVDAASNNKIEDMRTLLERVALGSPGRWKVYIIDEVHMLSTGSSNALLKTLEEPPGHVIFVLATTDPQKVLPTIRSRTQHYEFRLLGPELLGSLLADVNDRADLGLDPDTLDRVVRRGNGSARDALSALDQAAAAGGADDEIECIPAIVEALAFHDAGAALLAIAEAARRGRDPHRLAVEMVEHLRSAFLLTMAPEVAGVPDQQRAALEDQARRLGPAAIVRAMEVLGETLVAMRDALDTRVTFELALVRLCAPRADTSPAAIVERLELLERTIAGGGAMAPAVQAAPGTPGRQAMVAAAQPPARPDAPSGPDAPSRTESKGRPETPSRPDSPARPDSPSGPEALGRPDSSDSPARPDASARPATPSRPATPARPDISRRPDAPAGGGPAERPRPEAGPPPLARRPDGPIPRPTIGAMRQRGPGTGGVPAAPAGAQVAAASMAPRGTAILDRDELTKIWGDVVLPGLPNGTRSIYRHGRWAVVDQGEAVFVLPTTMYRDRAEEKRSEVEQILGGHFGGRVVLRLEVERGAPSGGPPPPAPTTAPDDDHVSIGEFAQLERAPDGPSSAEAKLLQAFPGSEEIGG